MVFRVMFDILQINVIGPAFLNCNLGSEVRALPTFLAPLIFGFVYQALLLYDTLSQRSTIQLADFAFSRLVSYLCCSTGSAAYRRSSFIFVG
jgi:hypothetical protein